MKQKNAKKARKRYFPKPINTIIVISLIAIPLVLLTVASIAAIKLNSYSETYTTQEVAKNPATTNVPSKSISIAPTKLPLFSLFFHAVNYATPQPSGINTNVTISLYAADGTLVGKGIPTPLVHEGNISTGGDVQFSVPLGTYKAVAETEKLQGSSTVTISSYNDQQYYGINLHAKPMTLSGKYFYDANQNTTYDSGEQVFANKRINAFVKTGGQLYSAGSTTTNDAGDFSITVTTYAGSYALGAEQVSGYRELPQRWVDLSGGESINYNIYLWPR